MAVLLQEPGHARLADHIASFDFVCASSLLEAELHAVLAREELTFGADLFDGVRWIFPQRPLTPEIDRVLRAGHMRGADLWHLACALYVFDDASAASFVSLDARQISAARGLGFVTD